MAKNIPEGCKNPLCDRCLRACKQSGSGLLLECPRFLRRPFKVTAHRFEQLDLFRQVKSEDMNKDKDGES